MTTPDDPEIDWSLTTWKGARRKQHQEFQAIPFGRKLEIIEEMNYENELYNVLRNGRGVPGVPLVIVGIAP